MTGKEDPKDAFASRIEWLLSPSNAASEAAQSVSPTMKQLLQKYREHRSRECVEVSSDPPGGGVVSSEMLQTSSSTLVVGGGLLRRRKDPLEEQLRKLTKTTSTVASSFHWSFRALADMNEASWAAVRQELGIEIVAHSFKSNGGLFGLRSTSIPPARCWDELPFRASDLRAYVNSRYAFPSPIQAQSLAVALHRPPQCSSDEHRQLDLLGVAETGSGKTLCYLLPALDRILVDEEPMTAERAQYGPLALVLVPTRELAEQVTKELDRLKTFSREHGSGSAAKCCQLQDIQVVKCVGGESVESQYAAIARGVHIIVGTPGQVLALLQQRYLSLGNTKYVAIDEADRMVEESMTPQLCKVLEHCPTPRQTILFTATMLPECEEIALKFLSPRGYFVIRTPYTFLSVWQIGELFPVQVELAAAGVDVASELFQSKLRRLVQWLTYFSGPTIVFVNEKQTCDLVAKSLRDFYHKLDRGVEDVRLWDEGNAKDGMACPWLAHKRSGFPNPSILTRVGVAHAGMSQDERRQAVAEFQRGATSVLVTTDLLARGLDVRHLDLVINFELPVVSSSSGRGDEALMRYIHRIGRTGRAGHKGAAVSFVVLPAELVTKSSAASSLFSTKQTDSDAAGEAARPRITDDDDDDVIASRKRDRMEGAPDVALPTDRSFLKSWVRFLADCSIHTAQSKNETDFFEKSRSHALERFTIAEPLLLAMHGEVKDVSSGRIVR